MTRRTVKGGRHATVFSNGKRKGFTIHKIVQHAANTEDAEDAKNVYKVRILTSKKGRYKWITVEKDDEDWEFVISLIADRGLKIPKYNAIINISDDLIDLNTHTLQRFKDIMKKKKDVTISKMYPYLNATHNANKQIYDLKQAKLFKY